MAEVFNMELRDGAEEEEISDEDYPSTEGHTQVAKGDNFFQLTENLSYAYPIFINLIFSNGVFDQSRTILFSPFVYNVPKHLFLCPD